MSDVSQHNYKSRQDFEQLLVHGYIRNIQKELTSIIPDSITILCLDHHGIMDYFSVAGSDTNISDDGSIATKKDDAEESYDNTTYGSKWIPSNQDAIIKWTLRILSNGDSVGVFIGIINNDTTPYKAFWRDKSKDYYVYENAKWFYDASRSLRYGENFGKDDIIMMELNLKNESIQFYKNDKSQGIASKNIVKNNNTRYKLMISLYAKKDSIQIVNFQKTSC